MLAWLVYISAYIVIIMMAIKFADDCNYQIKSVKWKLNAIGF